MRGLPPPPLDVVHLTQTFDVDDNDVSVGFWLFNPSNVDAIVSELQELADAWFLTCLPNLLGLMHEGSVATTCRLTNRVLSYAELAPPNHGALTGGQADNVAVGLHWLTGAPATSISRITYVPATPDLFVDRGYRLSATGWGTLRANGTDLYNALNALPAPSGGTQAVGVVNRSRSGIPLSVATFTPYIGVVPTPKVVTIRRRIPSGRRVSPL